MLKGTFLLTGADLIGGLLDPFTWITAVATAFIYERFCHAGKWGGIAVTCLIVFLCAIVSPQGTVMGLGYVLITGVIHRRKVATT